MNFFMLVLSDCFVCLLHELSFSKMPSKIGLCIYIDSHAFYTGKYSTIRVVTPDILCSLVWVPVDFSVWAQHLRVIFWILFSPNWRQL